MLNKTLFNNGKVWQENAIFQEAFGVEGKHFNFTGSNADATRIKNNYNKIIDLEGRLVLPGLIDGHVHLANGSLMKGRLDCSSAKTIDDLRIMIKDYVKMKSSKEWIVGGNLNLNLTSLPINVLDDIISDRPAYIINYDRHSGFCNSLALEKSGLTSKLTEFNDIEIPKNSNLRPAGTVKE
ncbi:MAG: amidohydrolase family protein, partial [Ignavibacteria bacterium]